jgi:hypothetical protein
MPPDKTVVSVANNPGLRRMIVGLPLKSVAKFVSQLKTSCRTLGSGTFKPA